MLHHIQKQILDQLATADSRPYSEIKPAELAGNVFGYHLKSLLRDKYVAKNDDGSYSLLKNGREYIVHRYEDPATSAHTIFLIVVQNGADYLLRTRRVQPLLGYSGFIHGEPQPGQSVVATAEQRLSDKTGLQLELTIKGSALIAQTIDDELQSYSHAVILYGVSQHTDIISGDATGDNFWGQLDTTDQLLPSCHDIVSMIDRSATWLEKTYSL